MKKTSRTINNQEYYRLADIARLSGTNIRSLRRYLEGGELINFITIYVTDQGTFLYRQGTPNDDDVLAAGCTFKYRLPKQKGAMIDEHIK